MKILLSLSSAFFLLLILAFSSCKEDDPVIAPIDQLPPLTNTGENTFGCLVNGEVLVTKSKPKAGAIIQGGVLQLFGTLENKQVDKAISIYLGEFPRVKTYNINATNPATAQYRDQVASCRYETDENATGFLTITFLDNEKYIISGIFEFTAALNQMDSGVGCQDTVHVTDGRFDIKYIP
jgi:hypothetical protein